MEREDYLRERSKAGAPLLPCGVKCAISCFFLESLFFFFIMDISNIQKDEARELDSLLGTYPPQRLFASHVKLAAGVSLLPTHSEQGPWHLLHLHKTSVKAWKHSISSLQGQEISENSGTFQPQTCPQIQALTISHFLSQTLVISFYRKQFKIKVTN